MPLTEMYQLCIYTSSSAMADRPRELGDFKGMVTLKLKFKLNGHVSRQYLWTVR